MRLARTLASALALPLVLLAALAPLGTAGGGGSLVGFPSFASVSLGGQQALLLDAGADHAGRAFLILGSASGTTPGTSIAGLPLALNPDDYFGFTLIAPNEPYFANSNGTLDGEGRAIATLDVPLGTDPALAGVTLHHAFVLYDPVCDFVSNSVPLDLIP